MLLCPVEQCKFELCHAAAERRIVAAFAHFLCHILANSIDAWVVLVLLVSYEQVELRVLLYLYAEFIQALDRSVAGEEVLRTRTEGDNLQALETKDDASYGNELCHHLSHFLCCTYRILRDIALEVAHAEVVRAVEHTAISVATAIDHVAVAFCSCNKHARTIEVLCDKGFWSLRTEVAKEYNESVAASLFHFSYSLEHVFLVFYCSLAVKKLTLVSLHDILATLC